MEPYVLDVSLEKNQVIPYLRTVFERGYTYFKFTRWSHQHDLNALSVLWGYEAPKNKPDTKEPNYLEVLHDPLWYSIIDQDVDNRHTGISLSELIINSNYIKDQTGDFENLLIKLSENKGSHDRVFPYPMTQFAASQIIPLLRTLDQHGYRKIIFGSQPNQIFDLLTFAVHLGAAEGIEGLLQYREDRLRYSTSQRRTALTTAINMRRVDLVDALLDRLEIDNTPTDEKLSTPLLRACANGDIAIVSRLLERGYSKKTESCRDANWSGETIIHLAIANNDLEMVKWLLTTNNATIQDRSHHRSMIETTTPIDRALHYGHYELAHYLVTEHHAEWNAKDQNGQSTLYKLINNEKFEAAEWMLDQGLVDLSGDPADHADLSKLLLKLCDIKETHWERSIDDSFSLKREWLIKHGLFRSLKSGPFQLTAENLYKLQGNFDQVCEESTSDIAAMYYQTTQDDLFQDRAYLEKLIREKFCPALKPGIFKPMDKIIDKTMNKIQSIPSAAYSAVYDAPNLQQTELEKLVPMRDSMLTDKSLTHAFSHLRSAVAVQAQHKTKITHFILDCLDEMKKPGLLSEDFIKKKIVEYDFKRGDGLPLTASKALTQDLSRIKQQLGMSTSDKSWVHRLMNAFKRFFNSVIGRKVDVLVSHAVSEALNVGQSKHKVGAMKDLRR